MARSVPEATIAVGRIRAMPFGRSRAEAAARQVRLIEAEGPDEVRAYALESLVEALTWMGAADKAVVPFVKLLRWWDAHPELFDTGDQNILFWEFGWVVNDLCRNPAVPVARVERTLDDMERRFRLANRGMERVWSCRLDWELLRRGPALDATFTTWLTMAVDDEDSCPACHQEHHADYLLEAGDLAGAVAVLEAALDSQATCSREPASMLALLAWCYIELGQPGQAEQLLPQAIAEVRGATSMSVLVAHARLFEVLARGHQLTRAVEMLPQIDEAMSITTPYVRLEALRHLLAGLAALERAGQGQQAIMVPGVGATTVAAYVPGLRAEAEQLTQAFDARHVNQVQAARLARALSATPAPRALKLATTVAVEPVEPVEPPAAPARPAVRPRARPVRERAERAWRAGRHKQAADLYRQAADEAQQVGQLAQAGWFWAEAARNAQQVGRVDLAAHDYGQAQSRLRAAGLSLEEITPLFVAWAPVVRQQDYRQFVDLAMQDYPTPARPQGAVSIEQIMPAIVEAGLLGSPLIKRYVLARAELRDALARVMATWGDHDDGQAALEMAQESASRLASLGRTDAASHAWWLAGKVGVALGAEAATGADTNFVMALHGFRSIGERGRRFSAQVVDEFAEYLMATGRAALADELRASWKNG